MESVNGASAMASEPRYISPVPVANGQRRAVAGADDQILLAAEHDGQRKGPFQPLQRGEGGVDGGSPPLHLARHQMGHHFRIGLRGKRVAVGDELGAQLGEILDDAVMDHRHIGRKMRVRIGLVGPPVGLPSACGRCRWCRPAVRRRSAFPD